MSWICFLFGHRWAHFGEGRVAVETKDGKLVSIRLSDDTTRGIVRFLNRWHCRRCQKTSQYVFVGDRPARYFTDFWWNRYDKKHRKRLAKRAAESRAK